MKMKIRHSTGLASMIVVLALLPRPSAAGPASGQPLVDTVFGPYVAAARFVCVDDVAQECVIDANKLDDVNVEFDEQINCGCDNDVDPSCVNPCAERCPGQGFCRPVFIPRSGDPKAIVELIGTLTLDTTLEEGDPQTFTIDVTATFLKSRNPRLANDESIDLSFSDTFVVGEDPFCSDSLDQPGVQIPDSVWFPPFDGTCIFEQNANICGGPGLNFNGQVVPLEPARGRLLAIAKVAFATELAGFDPAVAMVDFVKEDAKRPEKITGTAPYCAKSVDPTFPPAEGANRVASYEIAVRFLEPHGGVPAKPKKCDADADGGIDGDDIRAIMRSQGPAAGAAPAMDANSDGVIDVRDARLCALLCDVEGCP